MSWRVANEVIERLRFWFVEDVDREDNLIIFQSATGLYGFDYRLSYSFFPEKKLVMAVTDRLNTKQKQTKKNIKNDKTIDEEN